MAIDTETLKKMLKDPADHFTSPAEVLTHSDLNHEQKQSILESWKVDEQELAKATEENMGRMLPPALRPGIQWVPGRRQHQHTGITGQIRLPSHAGPQALRGKVRRPAASPH